MQQVRGWSDLQSGNKSGRGGTKAVAKKSTDPE